MITVDKKQGMASDHGELWLPNAEQEVRVIVDLSLEEDDGQFCVSFAAVGEDSTSLYFPMERLKALLKG